MPHCYLSPVDSKSSNFFCTLSNICKAFVSRKKINSPNSLTYMPKGKIIIEKESKYLNILALQKPSGLATFDLRLIQNSQKN